MIVVTDLLLLHGGQAPLSAREELENGTAPIHSMAVQLTIFGPPRTKKTGNQLGRTGNKTFVFPNQRWRDWTKQSRIDILSVLPLYPIDFPVNCRALFYRARNAGDASGYYQGLGDFLEMCLVCRSKQCSCNGPGLRVVANDKWIVTWDGSRLRKDKDNPRVEIVLEPADE